MTTEKDDKFEGQGLLEGLQGYEVALGPTGVDALRAQDEGGRAHLAERVAANEALAKALDAPLPPTPGEVADLRARLDEANDELAEIRLRMQAAGVYVDAAARTRTLLVDIQWRGPPVQTPQHTREPSCPACGAVQSSNRHAPDCRLAAEVG